MFRMFYHMDQGGNDSQLGADSRIGPGTVIGSEEIASKLPAARSGEANINE
mgnify:CR=1 FL=1